LRGKKFHTKKRVPSVQKAFKMKVKEAKAIIISELQKHPFLADYKSFASKGEFRKVDVEKGVELSIETYVFGSFGGCEVNVYATVYHTDFKRFIKKTMKYHYYICSNRASADSIIKEFSGIPLTWNETITVYNEDELNAFLVSVNKCLDTFIAPFFDKYTQIDKVLVRYYVESKDDIKAGSGPFFCKIGLLFSFFYKKEWIPHLLPIYEDYLSVYAPTIQLAEYKKARDYVLAN
jgi:hypothetical protein